MDEHRAARAAKRPELVVDVHAAGHRHRQPSRHDYVVLRERARHAIGVRVGRHVVRIEGVAFDGQSADPGVDTAMAANGGFTEERLADVILSRVAEFVSMMLTRR